MRPTKIKVETEFLFIDWEDDKKSRIRLFDLRRACPCAECAKERENQSSSYLPIYSDEQVTLENIKLVGRYAVSLKWKDGHNTGVYEFSQLKAF